MENERPGNPTHRGLRVLLNVLGAVCLLQAAWAFLPTAWLEATVNWWARVAGMEPFTPFWYGLRGLLLVFLGVAWIFPLKPLFLGIARPDPEASVEAPGKNEEAPR